MSLNKGKAKAKPAMKKGGSKTVNTASTAGIPKRAVMNSRSPKKDVAISGDTMSSYAMYKKGGKIKKYQAGTVVDAVLSSTERAAAQSPTLAKGMSKIGDVAIATGKALEKAKPAIKKGIDRISAQRKPAGGYKKGGSTKTKKFAALAPPYDKVTFADKIAGAKKASKKK